MSATERYYAALERFRISLTRAELQDILKGYDEGTHKSFADDAELDIATFEINEEARRRDQQERE